MGPLLELSVIAPALMEMFCDNQAAIFIASISKWIVTLFAVAEAHCYSLCSIRGPIGLDSHEAPSSYFLSATNLQAGHV